MHMHKDKQAIGKTNKECECVFCYRGGEGHQNFYSSKFIFITKHQEISKVENFQKAHFYFMIIHCIVIIYIRRHFTTCKFYSNLHYFMILNNIKWKLVAPFVADTIGT